VTQKGLPAELEVGALALIWDIQAYIKKIVVRDLWTLRLQTLQGRLESSDSDVERIFSSQSDSESTENDLKSSKRKVRTNALPFVLDGACMNYLGVLLLRLPVTVADIFRWIKDGELLYYRAITALDSNMKKRLPGRYHILLDPQRILTIETLHETALRVLHFYRDNCGMTIPAINHYLVLYRSVYTLDLPIELYAASLRLATLLGVGFGYDTDDPVNQRSPTLAMPEARLSALLVVATKLLFPFDGQERLPKRPTELAALGMDWTVWTRSRAQQVIANDRRAALGFSKALQTTEKDVLSMSNDTLDQYMDWYEKAYTEEQPLETDHSAKDAGFRRSMYRMFPVSRTRSPDPQQTGMDGTNGYSTLSHDDDSTNSAVQAAMKPLRVLSHEAANETYEDILRPGSHYKRYRSVNDLSETAAIFYGAVARLVGLAPHSLVRAVFVIESLLRNWEVGARTTGEEQVQHQTNDTSEL